MKNFNIFGVHWKIRLLGGILKNQYIGGDCLKGGGLGQFVDLRGELNKKDGVFLRGEGWYPNAHYDYYVPFGVIENRFTKSQVF